MQNPEIEKTSLRTNSPSKEKAHLPYVPSFLSWFPMSFPPVSSPAWGTDLWRVIGRTLQSSEQQQSWECFSGCLCSSVRLWYIHKARPDPITSFLVFPLDLHWECPVYWKQGSERVKGATHLAHRGCSLAVLLRINENKMGGWVTLLVLYFLYAFGRAGFGHPGLYTSSVFSELHWCRVLWTLRLSTSSIYLSSVSPVLKSWLPYRNPDFASLQIFSQMPVIRIYMGTSSQQTGNS